VTQLVFVGDQRVRLDIYFYFVFQLYDNHFFKFDEEGLYKNVVENKNVNYHFFTKNENLLYGLTYFMDSPTLWT